MRPPLFYMPKVKELENYRTAAAARYTYIGLEVHSYFF